MLEIKKDLKIPYVSHFICLLIIICIYATCKIWKFEISLLEILYILLLSVMKLNYPKLYQISSLEANLSLVDL